MISYRDLVAVHVVVFGVLVGAITPFAGWDAIYGGTGAFALVLGLNSLMFWMSS